MPLTKIRTTVASRLFFHSCCNPNLILTLVYPVINQPLLPAFYSSISSIRFQEGGYQNSRLGIFTQSDEMEHATHLSKLRILLPMERRHKGTAHIDRYVKDPKDDMSS